MIDYLALNNEYNLLMSSLQVSVSKHLLNEDFTVIWANDYYYKMTGYSKEEYDSIFHSSCKEYFKKDLEEYNKIFDTVRRAHDCGATGYTQICHMPQKNGSYIWIQLVGNFMNETYNGIPVIYVVYTDIDDFKKYQIEQNITYDNLPGFIAKFRIKKYQRFVLLDANNRFKAFFKDEYILPNSFVNLDDEYNRKVIAANYPRMRKMLPVQFELIAKDRFGNNVWFQISAEKYDTIQKDPIYLFLYIDITKQKASSEALSLLEFVDPVTNGFNRTRFEREMLKTIRKSPPHSFSFVSLDVQKFKIINDMFGIKAGDRVLKYIYDTFVSCLDENEYIARFSGDNFVLLLREIDAEKIHDRLREIIFKINNFNNVIHTKYILSFIAGVYCIDDINLQMGQMMDRANIARKRALECKGNQRLACLCYSDEDRILLNKEKDVENSMEEALINKEFVVYLQPKVSLHTEKIVGAEALVRWKKSEQGIIPPSDFIPIFERNGFITILDLYVFEEVCKLIHSWREKEYKLIPVSVNLSRANISNPSFLVPYERIRRQYNIPLKYLEFELTETMMFDNPHALIEAINTIHKTGYQCNMDDFGSGYSSLNMLKEMKFDTLKLDRVFFSNDASNSKRENDIVESIIDLARKLNMKTVAEGIETKTQVENLKTTKCDMIQGYVYSEPLPVEKFETMSFL